MALFHKARRTRSSTRLVCRADGASIALIPRAPNATPDLLWRAISVCLEECGSLAEI